MVKEKVIDLANMISKTKRGAKMKSNLNILNIKY